jgi:hypothetical protein
MKRRQRPGVVKQEKPTAPLLPSVEIPQTMQSPDGYPNISFVSNRSKMRYVFSFDNIRVFDNKHAPELKRRKPVIYVLLQERLKKVGMVAAGNNQVRKLVFLHPLGSVSGLKTDDYQMRVFGCNTCTAQNECGECKNMPKKRADRETLKRTLDECYPYAYLFDSRGCVKMEPASGLELADWAQGPVELGALLPTPVSHLSVICGKRKR